MRTFTLANVAWGAESRGLREGILVRQPVIVTNLQRHLVETFFVSLQSRLGPRRRGDTERTCRECGGFERTKMFTKKRLLGGIALATGAIIALSGCSGSSAPEPGTAQEFDPDEKVELDLAFWGDETRAGFYNEAIEAFNKEYPNITVKPQFLDFAGFWEKRQTEAAGGGLPDVMQDRKSVV